MAESRAGPLAVQKEAVGTTNILSDARKVSCHSAQFRFIVKLFSVSIFTMHNFLQALSERGDKLNDIAENTARMRDSADAFGEAAKALQEKYANRKWWQL